MTREDDFIGKLEGYLDAYEGHTPLPDAVRDAIRADLPTTRQIARRFSIMPNLARVAGAGLAVAIAGVVGASLLSTAGFGPFAPSPSPALTDYVIGPDRISSLGSHDLTVRVPAGWTDVAGRGVRKDDLSLTVWNSPHGLWVDPCHWMAGNFADPPTMRSMTYLALAFWWWWGAPPPDGFGDWAGDAQPTLPRGTAPTETRVDEYFARHVEFRVPVDLDISECDEGEYRIWKGTSGEIQRASAAGELHQLWILSAGRYGEEGDLVMIDASSSRESSAQDLAELQAMVDSIRIE